MTIKLESADFDFIDELDAEVLTHEDGVEVTWYENSAPIGRANLIIDGTDVVWHNLTIHESWQRKRLLSHLMSTLLPVWRRQGMQRYVTRYADNSPETIEMYESLGWTDSPDEQAVVSLINPGSKMEQIARGKLK